MQLRHHPLMTYRGVRNWPPAWVKSGLREMTPPALHGEIGTLTAVIMSQIEPCNRCYLLIDFKGEQFMGTLLFSDVTFCRQIHDVLQQHIGESIRKIGNLNLSFTL